MSSLVKQILASLRADTWFRLFPYLAYAIALIAAGLLPIKRHSAYQGVSLALALLWGLLAVAAWSSTSPWWAAVATLELLILLGLALWGKFEYEARTGPWAVTGTVVVVYSVLVFPILGRVFHLARFEHSAFGAPFPAVPFTCGILFFALEPITVVALAVPLAWALVGGPDVAAGVVELTGLQVALLAGALFLLQAPEVRRGNARLSPGAGYLYANRHRKTFNYVLWALVLATILCFFLAPGIPPRHIILHLGLLSALGIAVWLVFTAWQSLWYRAVAWWIARALGRVRVWFGYAWQWGVLLLAAAALWAMIPFPIETAHKQVPPKQEAIKLQQSASQQQSSPKQSAAKEQQAASQQPDPPKPQAVPSASNHVRRRAVQLFAAVTLLWLAYHAYRGRTRLVIGPFAGYTNDDKLDKLVAGLGPRLQSELARISDLYKVIDEATPSRKSGFVEVTPGVQDVGTILKDASAITLGPLKIPANLLVGLVGQIVSGPRLTGALHKVDDDFILTAELSGGGLSGNWRIDANAIEGPRLPPQATIQELVLQLAFRVATDLVAIGSPRWRAIQAFTEGLRAYRETQRQQEGTASKLREAERWLIRALNDDQQFTQCHFNLGVVYRQLKEHKSSQSAFRRALKEDPENFEACYALAEALATDKKYSKARWFSAAAIGINPNDARAWDLESFARRYEEQDLQKLKLTLGHDDPAWKEIRARSEIGVALAWRALCHRALAGSSTALQRERTTALLCTRNLAVVLARTSQFPHSLQLIRQAAWLAPRDPVLRLYEGRTLFWNQQRDAAKALGGILADGLLPSDQALLWSVLAQTQATGADAAHRASAQLARIRFLDVAADAKVDDLPEIVRLSLETPPDRASQQDRP